MKKERVVKPFLSMILIIIVVMFGVSILSNQNIPARQKELTGEIVAFGGGTGSRDAIDSTIGNGGHNGCRCSTNPPNTHAVCGQPPNHAEACDNTNCISDEGTGDGAGCAGKCMFKQCTSKCTTNSAGRKIAVNCMKCKSGDCIKEVTGNGACYKKTTTTCHDFCTMQKKPGEKRWKAKCD